MNIHGKEYTEVKDRIVAFLAANPEGHISTAIEWNKDDFSAVCIKAFVYPDRNLPTYVFTGLAYEERAAKQGEVNADAWVENCETSAIGRALANMNIGVNGTRPSAEEMKKVQKREPSKPVQTWREEVHETLRVIESEKTPASLKSRMELVSVDNAAGMFTEPEYKHIREVALAHFDKLTKKGK